MSRYLTEKYQSLVPYVPGEQPAQQQLLKLNTNESPYPPSEQAMRFASEHTRSLNLYPDPDGVSLTRALAETCSVEPAQIILSNGSDEMLSFAFQAYCDAKTPAIFPKISYGFYPVFAALHGVPFREIPLKDDLSIDPVDYYDAKGTVVLANPNAPTGLLLPVPAIEEITRRNPGNVVIVDEAYIDFGGESCIPLTKRCDNLLVVQTFSKSRALAGARLGFGVGSPALIADLQRLRYSFNPYNINSMTLCLGEGVLRDRAYFENCCQSIQKTRQWTAEALSSLGFTLTDSKANFLFARHPGIPGETLYQKLRERNILVRHFKKPQIENYVRITVGTDAQMQALVQTLKSFIPL